MDKIGKKKIYVDMDGIICTNENGDYEKAKPLQNNIDLINNNYEQGDYIVIWTARGRTTGKDWRELTLKQLKTWGVKYHKLRMDKPFYDEIWDDKCRLI